MGYSHSVRSICGGVHVYTPSLVSCEVSRPAQFSAVGKHRKFQNFENSNKDLCSKKTLVLGFAPKFRGGDTCLGAPRRSRNFPVNKIEREREELTGWMGASTPGLGPCTGPNQIGGHIFIVPRLYCRFALAVM